MPWKACDAMDGKVRFVGEFLKGEQTISELCRQLGVSRKTGYKWIRRYQAHGAGGLHDHHRRSKTHPNATEDGVVKAVLEVRRAHMTWGPRKIAAWLRERDPKLRVPAASTVGEILKRYGLVRSRRPREYRAERPELLTVE